jgi:hypothetical protein
MRPAMLARWMESPPGWCIPRMYSLTYAGTSTRRLHRQYSIHQSSRRSMAVEQGCMPGTIQAFRNTRPGCLIEPSLSACCSLGMLTMPSTYKRRPEAPPGLPSPMLFCRMKTRPCQPRKPRRYRNLLRPEFLSNYRSGPRSCLAVEHPLQKNPIENDKAVFRRIYYQPPRSCRRRRLWLGEVMLPVYRYT